ncbi:MAG TPA: SBBP repeat-containing protein [Candidatus Cloacimonas sp.]|nr:SBBP repeat-containing protein [Candidatus Cloacimonas sp.]HPS60520.1 SBBP repeat-containing protein [Candidatus Cloacimonas sp.]
MKKTFLLLILVLCSLALFAQNEDWHWAIQAGGTDDDYSYGIAIDSNRNSYVTGYFKSSSITFGTTTLTNSGYEDIFVAKMDSNGNWLWAKQAGGTDYDEGMSIAVDANGNSYVTGYFFSNANFGDTNLISSGYSDIYIAKLDSNGNWLWVKQAGGTSEEWGIGVAVDSNGNSYVTGFYQESATFGTITLTSSGGNDIFVAKLDSNGNWLWAKQAGGTSYDEGVSIAVDTNGNSYVTGDFSASATFGTTTLTSSGEGDIFVAKMDISGNWLWAQQAGGTDYDSGFSVAVDANGNIYVTGSFKESATLGTTTLTSSGSEDIFIAKLDSNGNWLWAKQAGGTYYDFGNSIAVDANGNSYVTGYFEYSATFGATTLTSSGESDIFVAKLNSNGNWLWAKQTGGTSFDFGYGIAVDANGSSYVTGFFMESATFGTTPLTSSGGYDIFVAKLGEVNSINLPDIIPFNGICSIYPNPFNPLTTIDYEISMPADVKIEVYNNRGQLVRSFALGYKKQGSYKLTWEGEDNNGCLCSSGIYYIKMRAGKEIYTKKAVLLK